MRCLLALSILLAGCAGEERTPDGTARLLLRAIESADEEKVLRLLAPQTVQKLEELARLATAQTGGNNPLDPGDLLVIGMNSLPGDRPLRVKGAKVQGDRAEVQLVDQKQKVRHTLKLVRVKGRWRIVLPPESLRPPRSAAPKSPASAPASQPFTP